MSGGFVWRQSQHSAMCPCPRCGRRVIGAARAEYRYEDQTIVYSWACDGCSAEFDTAVAMGVSQSP